MGGGAESPLQEKTPFLNTNFRLGAVRHGEESPLKAKSPFRPGFSLIGVLTASAIGMVVVAGMSQYMIQMKIQFSDKEKTAKRLDIHSFIGRFLDNSQACYNTLTPWTLTPAIASTDTAPFPEQKFQINKLKDRNGGTSLNFEKYKAGDTIPPGKAIGDIKDTDTAEKLRSLGIDKFEKLEFVYDKDTSSLGKVILHSRTEIKGFLEKKNAPIVWELSGISVESNKVTFCSEGIPFKVLCGPTATGRPHENGGGFVESTATVDTTAYVAKTAIVCGTAKVKDNARIFGDAQIRGGKVKDNALVYDNAKISGDAVIAGNAQVYDNAKISGNAVIKGHAQVFGSARVYENAEIYDNAKVRGAARVAGRAKIKAGVDSNSFNLVVTDRTDLAGNEGQSR